MNYKPRLNIDALIFSITDILVDVSQSYPEVVRETVQLYLEQAVGLSASQQPLLTPAEVVLLQKAGFFTNYLDLATTFIIYFIELLPAVPVPTFPSKQHIPAIMAYLQLAGGRLQTGVDQLRAQKDIAQLARAVAAAGGGPDRASAVLPKENRHLLVEGGDITKANLVGRLFQELYLGRDLFEQVYGQPTVFVKNTGYIQREALLIDRDVLAQLNQNLPLGIATNYSRIVLEYSLKARKIEQYFQAVVSLDEVRQAKARPVPHPWALLEAARHLYPTPAHSAYVTANPNHMQAAKAASQTVPFSAIGCLAGTDDRETFRKAFEKAKANVILGHPNHLKELILD
jgi:phosphoglycolate phosphatase-like HAD superfamily hydrolase